MEPWGQVNSNKAGSLLVNVLENHNNKTQ